MPLVDMNILSEDFSHGQVIEGVRVVNPFISEIPP